MIGLYCPVCGMYNPKACSWDGGFRCWYCNKHFRLDIYGRQPRFITLGESYKSNYIDPALFRDEKSWRSLPHTKARVVNTKRPVRAPGRETRWEHSWQNHRLKKIDLEERIEREKQ